MSESASELRALAAARSRYEAEGYSVDTESRLPSPLEGFRADAVAQKDGEFVVIELRPSHMSEQRRKRLNALADLIEANPGWRIDIVTFDSATDAREPAEEDARRRLAEARAIFDISPDAAILMTWSAIEGSLWNLSHSSDNAAPKKPVPPRQLLRQLLVDGLITDSQAALLDDFAQERNRVAHGRDATSLVEAEQLEWFLEFARAVLDGSLATVDSMIAWFRSKFESPDDAAIPYDGREGGYQWLGNGPHDATEVLTDQFADALPGDIAEAVAEIETDSLVWAKRASQ